MMYRQGDIYIRKTDVRTGAMVGRDRYVIAEGKTNGHKHVLEGDFVMLKAPLREDGTLICYVGNGATLTHDEHAPHVLKNGIYLIGIQREYEDAFDIKDMDERKALMKKGDFLNSIDDPELMDTVKTKSKVTNKLMEYKLFSYKLTNGNPARVLEVECPSIHEVIYLGIPVLQSTATVYGALAWLVPPELNDGKDMTAEQYMDEMEYET